MIKNIKLIIVTTICLLLITICANTAENKILLKINNQIITSLDILTELDYLGTINKEIKKIEKEKAFEISKNSIIREKIKEIEIKRVIKEIKIEDKILNNLIISYFKEFEINTISEFENFFLSKNIDPNVIKKKISIEVLWNQLIYSRYNQNVKIDKQLIKSNLSNNKKQTEFLISEILFNIDENEDLNKKFLLIDNSIKEINFAQIVISNKQIVVTVISLIFFIIFLLKSFSR